MSDQLTPEQMEESARNKPDVLSPGQIPKTWSYCSLPPVPERRLHPEIDPTRAQLIRIMAKKWVNGTIFHYYFFDKETDGRYAVLSDGKREWRTWTTSESEKDVVREAFSKWKELGIGIDFREVDDRDEAEIRIGFMRGDGAWSYVGRDIVDLNIGRDERTMNFGWDLTRDRREIDTAIHEIGHTLGFPHEHQNPNAGIVWDEEAVYTALGNPPNNWSRETTFHNIIRKIPPDTVQGSSWDADSVMHYPFGPGLIKEPEAYQSGIFPSGGLSERDVIWVKTFYPPIEEPEMESLKVSQSACLNLSPGEQKDFLVEPTGTRNYTIQTFGFSDTVMVLFEEVNDELRYLKGDDDSGVFTNSSIRVKLRRDRKYVLRIRLYYADKAGETAVMMW